MPCAGKDLVLLPSLQAVVLACVIDILPMPRYDGGMGMYSSPRVFVMVASKMLPKAPARSPAEPLLFLTLHVLCSEQNRD